MGRFFMMSKRFNKQSAQDFGLIDLSNGFAKNLLDGSVWQKTKLFDYGWGQENGYCKIPLPDYPELFSIVLSENDEEDVYGAAAIIERDYPEKLLEQCENMIKDSTRKKDLKKISRVFQLDYPINRCPIIGKSHSDIMSDSERWKKISEFITNTSEDKESLFSKMVGRFDSWRGRH